MANIEEQRSKRNLMSEEPEMGPAPRRILIDPSKVGRGVEQHSPRFESGNSLFDILMLRFLGGLHLE
jgi:hypothetical protein